MNCALCGSIEVSPVATIKNRTLYRCSQCDLVFVPKAYHLSVAAERARYDLHDNTAENEGYVRFLSQVADITQEALASGGNVLDFGCGEHAVLATLLRSRGIPCSVFDPLYDYPQLPPAVHYDVVVLCEVIEHCRDLPSTIRQLDRLCSGGVTIVVRTQCRPPDGDLSRWWYAQDMTHINLFSRRALEEVARRLRRSLFTTEFPDIFLVR